MRFLPPRTPWLPCPLTPNSSVFRRPSISFVRERRIELRSRCWKQRSVPLAHSRFLYFSSTFFVCLIPLLIILSLKPRYAPLLAAWPLFRYFSFYCAPSPLAWGLMRFLSVGFLFWFLLAFPSSLFFIFSSSCLLFLFIYSPTPPETGGPPILVCGLETFTSF